MPHDKFETSGDDELLITFSGFNVSSTNNDLSFMDQTFYVKLLEEHEPSQGYTKFRSMKMWLALLASTRPNLLFEVSQLEQITLDSFILAL